MWYREGTNSFEKGSKTVAGVGTFWSQAKYGVMPGMVLIGSDNLLYEIESVQSNTELTLVEAYKGNSVKDQPCRIITTYEGDLSQFSARFSALLHSISGDSREIRNWLTSPSPVVIVRDDGTTFKADSLETIYAAHKARIEWFDKNKTLISDAGNKAANAAGSAKAAKDSQIAAKASEIQAANLAKSAHDSQVAASTSQSAAKTSETNAKKSEINAANSAKAAAASQTVAKVSETNAANSAKGANASQTAAKISETNAGNFSNAAKVSELASKTSETNAKSSEVNAKSSETNAKSSSNSATEKAKQAAGSQIAAKASETSAATSKDASAKSASNASASASKAEQEANKAISSANNAATSASGSASSANSAKTSEINAKSSENKASTSETNAKASENNASASKLAAEKSAKDAASTLAKMGNDAKVADNAAKAAKLSENNSRASELAAKTSETNTANAAKAAKVSQDAAKISETNAANSTIVASAAQTAAKASETVAISSKNAAQEAANLATKKAESAAASESKAQDAANRATLSAKEKENLLKGKTVTISLGTHVATWTKIATVIMPQAASTVRIEIVGGSGFNTGEYQQAAMAEIVLRSGNDHPKGISASIYRTNIAAANHVATINTKDDEYDVYVHFGAYPFNLIFNVQQSNNATILNLGQLSKSSETLPEGVREGKTYHYILASAVDNQGNISIDKNIYGPGFVSGAQGQDRTWLEPKEGNACWLANIGDKYVGEFRHPKKSGTAAIVEDHYTKGESDGKYQPKGGYANAASHTFSGEIRAPYVISGSENNQSYFMHRNGIWAWTAQQAGVWKGEVQHPGRAGVLALQGDSYSKGESDGKYQTKIGQYISFGETNVAWTTAQFVDWIKSKGAFDTGYWLARGSWWYAGNCYITDTGVGNIHLAGCTVEVVGLINGYTIKIITPTTSASGEVNKEFIYVNNSNGVYGAYSPGWRRLYNTSSPPTAAEVGAYSKEESLALFAGYAKSLSNLQDRNFNSFFTSDGSSGWAKGVNISGHSGGDIGQFFIDSQGKFRARFLNSDGSIAEKGFLYSGDAYTKGESDTKHALKNSKETIVAGHLHVNSGGQYSGLVLKKPDNRYAVIETSPHGGAPINFIYREPNGTNISVASLPTETGVIALQSYSYSKDETNQNFVKNDTTNLGKSWTALTTIPDGGWAQPIGYSTMVRSDSVGLPNGFNDYGYWHVVAARDMAQGYAGFLTGWVSGHVYYGFSNTKEGNPSWVRVYTENHKPSPNELDVYSKGESDSKYQPKGNYAINQNVVPNGRKINGKLLSSDVTLNAADVGAFRTGLTEAFTEDKVPWNAVSGVYNARYSGHSQLIVHFSIGQGNTSTPSLQLKSIFKNGGIAYRSARDGHGFEESWTEFYTTKNKPSASDVDAYSKGESDNKYQLKGNFANKGDSYSKAESDGRYFGKSGGEIFGDLTLQKNARRHIRFHNGAKIDGYIYKDPDGHMMFNNGVHGGDWQMRTDGSFYCGGHGNFSGEVRAPNIITGAGNNQSYFYQHEGAWRWTVQQGGTWKGEIQHPGRGGVFALQGDSYTKDESDGKYQSRGDYAINQNVVPNGRKINGKLLTSDITLNAADVGAFRTGLTEAFTEDKVPWNAVSGVYNARYSGHSQLIVHFSIGQGNTSTPSLQLKSIFKNGGIAYRSARDGHGFEESWTEFYTTKNKPSASDVDAYSKGESDNKYQLKGNFANKGESYTKGESDGRYFGKSGGEISGNFTLKSAARRHIIFNNGTKVDGYIYKDPDGHMMFNNGVHGGDWQMRTDGSFYCGGHGNFSGEIRSPNVITGAVNNQSYFFQHEGVWRWTVQQGGTWKGEIQHPGRGGVFALQGDSYTKGESDGRYLPKSGGTLSGALTVNNNLRANTLTLTTSSSSWINMRSGHCLTSTGIVNNAAAAPIVRQEHTDRHFMVAGLGNLQFGFYMLNKGRKDNGVDAAAYLASDGSWYCNGNGNFNDVYIRSDKRAKNDIQKISDAGKKLSKLSGYTYIVSDDNKNSSRSAGLIAQEVQKVLPEAVTQDENDLLRLNYNSVIGLLVEAVKDLQKQVDELTKNR